MDSLVDTLVSLPLEARALALTSVAVFVVATAQLLRPRRRRRPTIAALRSTPDPVLAPETPRRSVPEGLDFDSQETIVPGRVAVPRPVEQIDLLSPAGDDPLVTRESPDPATLVEAKRRLESAAARTAASTAGRDNLTAINGLSPSHARALDRVGIRSFAQLSQLTDDEIAAAAIVLSCSPHQIRADDWIGQARAAQHRG